MQCVKSAISPILALVVGMASAQSALAVAQIFSFATVDTTFASQVFDGGADSRFASAHLFTPVFHQTAPGVVLAGSETADSRASAGVGTLRISGGATQGIQGGNSGSFFPFHAVGNADARFVIDDLIVSPPAGGGPAFALVSLRFSVSGLVSDATASGQVFDTMLRNNSPDAIFGTAGSSADLFVQVARTGGGGLLAAVDGSVSSQQSANYAGPLLPSTFGTLNGFFGHEGDLHGGTGFIFETGPRLLPVDVPLRLSVQLRGKAESNVGMPEGGGLFEGIAQYRFDHTVTFATDFVATLPNGFTLNSLQAGIVDNVWTPTAVPLPASAWLLLAALGSLARSVHDRGRMFTARAPVGM